MTDSESLSPGAPGGSDPFASTHWSLVLAAAGEGATSRSALETLCRTYWFPVYAFVRRRVANPDQALDLTQEFFAELLERKTLAAADPLRGRFRGFLLTALKNFLSNERAKSTAQKRGGGRLVFSLDRGVAESELQRYAVRQSAPEQEFERRWALALLNATLERLRHEYEAAGKALQFQELRFHLTGQNANATYRDASRKLGTTEQAARAAAYRLRKRYRELLLNEIAQTVAAEEDAKDELQRLFKALDS